MPITREDLARLEARQIAFLEARLTSSEAAAAWSDAVAAFHATLLGSRVGDVIDARALADALDAALASDTVERAARPLARHVLHFVLAELRSEKGTVKAHIPPSAAAELDALVARPGLLPERALREIAEQDAIDEILRDVLYDGFKEFSEKVNPFTAEWGIPSVLKRMSVLGGAVGKGLESVKAEFDRRLEPEIRRFLAGFSRKGLRRMVDVTIARADQPSSIALRRHMVAWLMDQEIASLTAGADDETLALALDVGITVAAAELARAETKTKRRAAIEAAFDASKDKTVRAALGELGVTLSIDHVAVARATWPAFVAVLKSDAVRAWIAETVSAFYAAEARALTE